MPDLVANPARQVILALAARKAPLGPPATLALKARKAPVARKETPAPEEIPVSGANLALHQSMRSTWRGLEFVLRTQTAHGAGV